MELPPRRRAATPTPSLHGGTGTSLRVLGPRSSNHPVTNSWIQPRPIPTSCGSFANTKLAMATAITGKPTARWEPAPLP